MAGLGSSWEEYWRKVVEQTLSGRPRHRKKEENYEERLEDVRVHLSLCNGWGEEEPENMIGMIQREETKAQQAAREYQSRSPSRLWYQRKGQRKEGERLEEFRADLHAAGMAAEIVQRQRKETKSPPPYIGPSPSIPSAPAASKLYPELPPPAPPTPYASNKQMPMVEVQGRTQVRIARNRDQGMAEAVQGGSADERDSRIDAEIDKLRRDYEREQRERYAMEVQETEEMLAEIKKAERKRERGKQKVKNPSTQGLEGGERRSGLPFGEAAPQPRPRQSDSDLTPSIAALFLKKRLKTTYSN